MPNDKLVESLKNLETHLDLLKSLPGNKTFIGQIHSATVAALGDIQRALEALAEA